MKRKYKVVFVTEAKKDIINVARYISVENPGNAFRIIKKIRSKAETLKVNPKRGRCIPELTHFDYDEFRELIVDKWRIIYRIHNQEIQIVGVLDSRRDLDDIIYQRFILEPIS